MGLYHNEIDAVTLSVAKGLASNAGQILRFAQNDTDGRQFL